MYIYDIVLTAHAKEGQMRCLAVFKKEEKVLDVLFIEMNYEDFTDMELVCDSFVISKKREQLEKQFGCPVSVAVEPVPRQSNGSFLPF